MLRDKSALIAMSGGVDSSVAALLTLEHGFDCVGSMMKLFSNEEVDCREKSCCSLTDADDARAVANKLGIPFYVFNFSDVFKEKVIHRFVEIYQNGGTPNPCIDCNRFLKFGKLLHRAHETGRNYLVTGHYAQIKKDLASDRFLLKKSVDLEKDQSYVLYAMTQDQLKHTLLPLGGMTKSQTREIAIDNGFVNAKKQDSQDICFVPNGNYADFINKYTGKPPAKGQFLDTDGSYLGEHKGIIYYTIGQRRGLGLSGQHPMYVCSVCAEANTVTVGTTDKLNAKTLIARDINLIPIKQLDSAIKVHAKLRYKQVEQPATVWQLDSDTLRIEFDAPQRAPAKGQAVVLYDGDLVIGGGTIDGTA